ncbi:hypothetical protein Poli38472_006367 [Pythium oligandrum]|uniref:LRRK2 ARM repeat domain-containing protein n=1 Tax=Pythium oligandrum TaxID=41045 RepID=A0A8K1FE81_PYTOL|nr:hypothetical protein Poli38472_006367 [Pythium oligandrum]|eukprot:TMW56357.1 hypothetical protein Poli38472_006367 [Pythium oligandrum]
MVLHTTTRMEGAEGPTRVVPEPVKEALDLIESASPLVTAEGFAKLAHATFNNPICKEAAGANGAIKLIADAMARNLDNASVQEDGCHVLRNVVFHCDPNVQLVREEGGLAAVLNAMQKHPDNEAVQAEGCWALVVFCSNHEENVAAAKASQSVIEHALQKHPNNKDINTKGRFLQALLA